LFLLIFTPTWMRRNDRFAARQHAGCIERDQFYVVRVRATWHRPCVSPWVRRYDRWHSIWQRNWFRWCGCWSVWWWYPEHRCWPRTVRS